MRTKNPKFNAEFGNTSSSHTCVRALNDPVAVAPGPRGATEASARDFRMLGGARELETPLLGTSSDVRRPPARTVQKGRHHWRMGMRLGPLASGEGANYV